MSRDAPSGLEVAIVGMAGRFPGARGLDEFWANLRAGVESVRFYSPEELRAQGLDGEALADPAYVPARPVLADVDLFDAAFFGINPREAEILDPQHRIFLEIAAEALMSAGHDPTAVGGPVGVYAGCGMSQYLLYHLATQPEVLAAAGELPVVLGNDKDYLATRVSYKLDLEGPSVSVQTACSTSLVAVHLACQGLVDGDCDLALAGGVSIDLSPPGYLYHKEGILSPDGHCRTFDAEARGTIFGSGAGVVVLKRLEDAITDRDLVRAVILGSAINNDGGSKVGFTAPRVEGQMKVVRAAHTAAGVDPASIGYVEAHGTATPIGDPIEIEALTRAFRARTPRRGFCAIGSVKSNVGHLDTAAGIAGLVKTVLSLEHGEIPASLHFERSNPQIPFDESPFFVNAERRSWERGETPRRAGVSSFGIGGTNAHVVLEEAPPRPSSGPARPLQLLVLSAASPSALERLSDETAEYLEHTEEALADVAFTLATGRRALPYRRALVAGDAREAARALAERDRERLLDHAEDSPRRHVVFLFPGQGSQYPGMGTELYGAERAYRRVVDRAAELLEPRLGLDLRQAMHAPPGDEAARRLRDTRLAQPALFVAEYALARLWMEWGVEPEAMIGHSVGELVAAAIAGVFTFENALELVAERSRLMAEQPPGAMLSLQAPAEELLAELPRELSLAVVNGPRMTVVSGPEEAIAGFARRLTEQDVEHRRLHTSHAFHSSLMGPAVSAFRRRVEAVLRKSPRIPFLSNLTGTWITDREATDPDYWARHLRQTVRFGDGLAELYRDPDRVLLEVGPGRALSTLARRHPERPPQAIVLASGHHPDDRGSELETFYRTAARMWLTGAGPSWRRFYDGEERRRVLLPAYPFERRRFWVDRGSTHLRLGGGAGTDEAAVSGEPEAASSYPRPTVGTSYEAPRDETERQIAAVWQEALGIEHVGIHDEFLELGGHSLLATQVTARLEEVFGVEVSVRELFSESTVARLAARIAKRAGAKPTAERGERLPSVVPDPAQRYQPFPLTDVQQAYWVGRGATFELGNVATHMYTELEGEGLDLERLETAWQRLVERHDMLRAIVSADGRQRILKSVEPYRFALLDLSHRDPGEVEAELERRRREMSHQVLPAERWPLFDIRATRLPGNRLRLHVSFDFLIGDAWSIELLTREWFALYRDPDLRLEPLELSFRDYVLAEEAIRSSAVYQRSLEYWRGRLARLPGGPQLPLLRNPASLGRPTFTRHAAELAPEAWERLRARATAAGLTPSAVVLAAFAEVLARWSKSPRFLLTLTLFNRLPLHPQVDEMVGDFTSLTLLEVDASSGTGFVDRARALHERLLSDLDHRHVSGVRVLREIAHARGENRGPAVPVVFTSLLGFGGEVDEGARSEGVELVYAISQTPQVWIDHQVGEREGALVFNWDAVDELFPPRLIDDMFAAYRRLLERLSAEVPEEAGLEDLGRQPLRLSETQLSRREASPDSTGTPRRRLEELFTESARRHPDRPAVLTAERALTYDDLMRTSRGIARDLERRGARRGTLVAVAMEKGWEQAVATLGVLDSGAAYLPVDPALPERRFRRLLELGEVSLALTQPHLASRLAWPVGVEPMTVTDDGLDGRGDRGTAGGGPGDLAYVIFTSGSTGEPKGVMIDHRAVANTVLDVNRRFDVGPGDRVLALSSLSFDLSVYDLFGIFAAGGAVVVPEPGSSRRPDRWLELMERRRVTIWNSVPALAAMLAEHLEAVGGRLPADLRLLMFSGDWIPVGLPDRLRALAPEGVEPPRIVSLGGATEASIWSVLYPIAEVPEGWTSIPYGRSMAAQRLTVLDAALEPRPDWVPGDLYIGGAGVARGYWRDPRKTALSFVPDPETGGRLYRTGDLARWFDDGNLEFLGREDAQVKIQGYRIELGEVEAALAGCPGVRSAAVVAAGERHHLRLVGFVVPEPGTARETESLRRHLEAVLPAYMVPPALVLLERLPLTANGKVDRGALIRRALDGKTLEAAARDIDAEADVREEAAGDRQQQLAEIWRQVLGVEHVGVHDNFFALGGDSILGIQIVARANQQGFELTPDQVFLYPTVAELAAAAGSGEVDERPPPESAPPVVGSVPLTPIQHWFFEHRFPRPGHWNQALTLTVRRPLPARLLAQATDALLEHHDALRLRFAESGAGWRAFNAAPGASPPVVEIDLGSLAPEDRRPVFAAAAGRLQASLDLARGPLLRLGLFRLGSAEPDQLLLIFHHLVVDGLSWRLLLQDLELACRQLDEGEAVSLPPKTESFKRWAERVNERAWAGVHEGELPAWTAAARRQAAPLPRDLPGGPELNLESTIETVHVELDPDETRALLEQVPTAHRSGIQDVLLAALAFALDRFAGGGPQLIDLETHGRGVLGDELDVTRTVGWFTAVYPLVVEVEPGGGAVAALRTVKAARAALPGDGAGYGVLRYLSPRSEVSEALRALPQAEVSFNYLGQFDAVIEDPSLFAASDFPSGPWNGPELHRRHLLFVFGSVQEGKLQVGFAYSRNLHRAATIESLAADFRSALAELTTAAARGERALVAADFPLARLAPGELEQVAAAVEVEGPNGSALEIDDVYPLSPMQEGLLFHCIYSGDGDLYVTTFACTLPELDAGAFEDAWQAVIDRHPTLRTAFAWEGLERPLQVVARGLRLEWRRHDWRRLTPQERRARLERLLAEEPGRVAPLRRAPLLRLTLVRINERDHLFVFSHHHLILDGWSLPVLLGEVASLYAVRRRGEDATLRPSRPFRDYLAWLARQDSEAANAHWNGLLGGFAAPTRLGVDRGPVGAPVHESGAFSLHLEPEPSERLAAAARAHGLTLSSVVQGAWAVLLWRHSGSTDLVYGLSVAGRPPELAGIEDMLGVFTNTLPVRARIVPRSPAGDWLARLQEQLVEMRRFEHSALSEVQKASDVPAGTPLFETLVVFENYPAPTESAGGDLEMRDVETRLKTSYPLLVGANVSPAGLGLDLSYDRRRFDPTAALRLLGGWRVLLEDLALGLATSLTELSCLSAAESQQLLHEWNDTASATLETATVLDLVDRHAVARGEHPAIAWAEGEVSYRELVATSRRLAWRLRAAGIGRGEIVGIDLSRTPRMVAALLAIHRLGCAYLPLDPRLPRRRLEEMIRDARPAAILTESGRDPDLEDAFGIPTLRLAPEKGDDDASGEPDRGALPDPRQLAYLIYTSGSSGRPKAVMIEHRSLLDHALVCVRDYGLLPEDRVLQFASLAFDASAEEIFASLVAGSTLVLRREGLDADADFLRAVAAARVTVLDLPTAFWHHLAGQLESEDLELPERVRLVVVGGEELRGRPLEIWRRHVAASVRLVNSYGPTEATVGATLWKVPIHGGRGVEGDSIPIGRPIGNTHAWVCGRDLRPLPIGSAGELCLSGVGLARGYLGRPALSAERFLPDPHARTGGERLYRSGDLARWLPSGEIEFLGRIDQQVKVRGFRIELGDIEAALVDHPSVAAAAVVAGDGGGHLRLRAFAVTAGEPPDVGELRRFVADRLPDYMLPASFTFLEQLPLNASDKVDRRALAAIEPRAPTAEGAYAAPRDPVEETLAGIWRDVLRLERVGIFDSFFELGGDSILSIQVVARALRAGLRISPQQIFEHRTVAALAAVAEAAAPGAQTPQGPVSGEASLTPIQRRFLDGRPPEPHHFNQALALAASEPLAPAALAAALALVERHHDALRLRFELRDDGTWRQHHAPPTGEALLAVLDLTALATSRFGSAFESAAAALQRAFDLARGPLLRAALFPGGNEREDRLLLVVHHLVIDAVSWRILLEDLELAYLQLQRSGSAELAPKTTSFQAWGEALEVHSRTPGLAAELELWRRQLEPPGAKLPIDRPGGRNTAGRVATVVRELPADSTRGLLREVPSAYDTRIDEALLTALAFALSRFAGADSWTVELEGHGREELFAGVDLSRTVGWFTHLYPVRLGLRGGVGETLKATKESLRKLPNRGLGYGVLTSHSQLAEELPSNRPELLFNYLGQLDLGLPQDSLFRVADEATGAMASPLQEREHLLEVNAGVSGGHLQVAWTYGRDLHRRESIERLADLYVAALEELVDHCRSPEAGGYTPSDFPLMDFDQGELDRLAEDLAGALEEEP